MYSELCCKVKSCNKSLEKNLCIFKVQCCFGCFKKCQVI